MKTIPIDRNRLEDFERQLDPQHPERSAIPARILGYGEISTVLDSSRRTCRPGFQTSATLRYPGRSPSVLRRLRRIQSAPRARYRYLSSGLQPCDLFQCARPFDFQYRPTAIAFCFHGQSCDAPAPQRGCPGTRSARAARTAQGLGIQPQAEPRAGGD